MEANKIHRPRIAMISGHIDISPVEFANAYHGPLDTALANGDSFIMGDAKGVDEMALAYPLSKDTSAAARIVVYASRAYNVHRLRAMNVKAVFAESKEKHSRGRQRHLSRDVTMTQASDYDILWVRSESESRALYGDKYRSRVSATELNRLRRLEQEKQGN